MPKKLSEQFLNALDDTASKTEVLQLFRTLMRLMREEVNKVRDDMPEMPDMEAEHKMMEERMVELEAKIPIIPPKFDPSNIFQELTNLVATVEELEKRIEELMKRPAGRLGSGGTSAIGVAQTFKWIAH